MMAQATVSDSIHMTKFNALSINPPLTVPAASVTPEPLHASMDDLVDSRGELERLFNQFMEQNESYNVYI